MHDSFLQPLWDDDLMMSSYIEGVAAKVLLPREPLATHGTGEGPLSCVAADVSLHDSLLLGGVRTEWALVEFHLHYQTVACRRRERPTVQIYLDAREPIEGEIVPVLFSFFEAQRGTLVALGHRLKITCFLSKPIGLDLHDR